MESSRVLDASAAPCCDGSEQLGDSFGESEKLGDELVEDLESSRVLDASAAPCCDGSKQLSDSFGESEKLGDELLEDLESSRVLDAAAPCCDGSVQLGDSFGESEKLGDELLENLDSYLQDINDRLTISRMVSDSVIRGMVTAVKQEADEKIAKKELVVAGLKDMLYIYHSGIHENRSLGSPLTCHESKDASHFGMYYNFPDAFPANDRMGGSLVSLRDAAKDQFKTLKKEIDLIRGFSHIRITGTGPEQLGLDSLLQDNMLERWTAVDITIENLNATIDSVYKRVEDMFQLSRSSFCVWRQEQEFQSEIEAIVVKNCIRSLQEEFEEKVWDQITQFCGNGSVNWLERIKEISSLRQDLENISKSVPVYEIGQLTSLGSLEIGEEWSNDKRADHFHRKALSNHISSSTMMWEGNGKHEDSDTNVPENSDPSQLKHMSPDELITEMTKMRRNHESKVQEMTEENFCLKRELLKLREWGSPLAAKKDKEVEMLKKKIPDVISRLDDILAEHQKLHALRDGLESLLSENRQLRDLLSDKKKEVKWLSSQVSDAEDKMSQHHLLEANLLCVIEDAHIENLISGDVYKCVLEELMCQIRWSTQESALQYNIMRENYAMILEEAVRVAEPPSNYEIEDSDMESIVTQEVCGITCREALKDAEENVNNLYVKYANENKRRVSLEVEALEKEEALRLEEVVCKEIFKQEICSLTALVEEKEKLMQETAVALAKEKERFMLASQELDNLRDQPHQQKILLSERSDESNIMKGNLDEALEQIAQYNVKICELNQKLELAMKELRGVDKERRMLHDLNEETEKALSLLKVGEREHQKQMESTIILVQGLLKEVAGFECGVTKKISNISLRLETLISESHLLIPKVNVLRRTGLKFKQRLARRCSGLEKAEAEVDLLGDKVDALLNLLEKIYIALDHYSPILQHYPGITEILKLVKRELSGELTKPA